MKLVMFIVFVAVLSISHVESSQYRALANTKEDKVESLDALELAKKQVNLEGLFRISDGDTKRLRIVEKPDQIITLKNVEGDLYTKLSWQADDGFQRVKSDKIINFKTQKQYEQITLSQGGKFDAEIVKIDGVLFFKTENSRELELEDFERQ